MTAPVVAARSASGPPNVILAFGTGGTAIPLPSGIVAGNLLIAAVSVNNAGANAILAPSAGWSLLGTASSSAYVKVFYKIATGSDSLTVTADSARNGGYICFCVTGAGTALELASATGTGTTPDPPSLSPAGGNADYLWIALAIDVGPSGQASAAPSGYSNLTPAGAQGPKSNACYLASAEKSSTASSEDPGTFTIGGSLSWIGITLAVPPGVYVYKGAQTRADRYLGTRTDAQIYLGGLALFP